MANPTVPNATQKDMINNSAPDAKSVNVPDASDAKASQPAQAPAKADAQPVQQAQPARVADAMKADDKSDKVESSKSKDADQGTEPKVDLSKTTGKDHFEQQEANARMFEKNVGEDSFRKAARLEREAERQAAEGDPTRDPVAKQAAMDMNTPAPGAKRDAQKIKNIGEREAEKQAKRVGTD